MQKLSLVLYLIVLTNTSFGQQDISLKNIVPPSPEASAFIKYGTYQTGPYTGKPDITIPLYEIKTNNLSVPISLSYDETGIRVNNSAGWVGLNWSLFAGGMVSQMIVGEPDKLTTSTDGVPPRASDIVNNQTYFDYLKGLVEHDNNSYPDGEPDKFFYSLPNGKSGSFVLDRNRNIVQIPRTSSKISMIGSFSGFNIVDEAGVTYIFNNYYETTETYTAGYSGSSPVPPGNGGSIYRSQKTGYYLSEMISNDGLEHIYFTYENESSTSKDDSYSEYLGDYYYFDANSNSTNYEQNHHEYLWTGVRRYTSTPRLKTITFSNGKIEFARATNRLDDESICGRLDEITVYQKSSLGNYIKLKSFKFIHGYYYSTDPYAPNSGFPHQTMDQYRLRLDTLKLKDALGNEISSYKFSYNTTPLPAKTSCAQDWWGYYNGMYNNSTLVPTTSVPNGVGGSYNIGNADRNPVESFMKAGILEKITYPTGGYTVFETESHKMYASTSLSPQSYQATALGQSNNLVTQTFTVPSNVTAGGGSGLIDVTLPPYSYSDPAPFVKIKNLTTGQEQTINSTDLSQWFHCSIPWNFYSGDSYQLTASCYLNYTNATAAITASFYAIVSVPQLIPVGGLRIKSIKNYTGDNLLANEEDYRYGAGETGGGIFVGIPGNAYNYLRNIYAYWIYTYQCQQTPGSKQVFLGGPLFEQTLLQGSPVVYTDVVKYYGTPTSNAGKTVYYYGYQTLETHPLPSNQLQANNRGIITIDNSWKQGQLLKQEEYKKNSDDTYNLIASIQNTYNIFYTDTTYGLFAQTKFDRLVVWPSCLFKYFSDFAWAEYPVYSGYVQLAQTIEKKYDPNGAGYVQSIINHTYDITRRDIRIKTTSTNSKGETIESETKFPFHKSSLLTSITSAESNALDAMVTKNMLFPIEEIQRNNGTQTILKKTSYEYVNGSTIAPVNIRYQVKNNPIETRLQFTKYDATGNLVEQSKTNDVTKTYLWGYNKMYPVAEVTNTTYATAISYITQSILDNPSDDATLRNHLNNLRSIPNAQVTTYTYNPLVGITSQTDINGRTTYYYYDAFNRLVLIKDKDGNIVKKFCYNYLGQPGVCSLYGNTVQSDIYTKDDCPSGYTGSTVTYIVPANKYFASTQADANTLALNDVSANKRTYANANGTCNVNCSFSISSSFYDISHSMSSSGGVVTFSLTFYGYGTLSSGTSYPLGTITGGCKPSVNRNVTFSSAGRTWVITIDTSGNMTLVMAYGSSLAPYTTISTGTQTFNL